MNNYLTNNQLPIISNLFIQKQKELTQIAGNLQIADVKEDRRFEATVNHLKQQLLLTPIVIGEPKISGHHQTRRNVPPNFQNLMGGVQDVFEITVEFPFSGSSELLGYMPSGIALPVGRIFQTFGNTIDIEVMLTKLDKVEALNTAKQDMSTTLAFVAANNMQAQQWAIKFEPIIINTLNQRRKELTDFYS